MEKKIISIGYEIPSHSNWHFAYSSNQSLLDADIVLFEPDFSNYHLDYPEHYQGKPLYNKNSSFDLQEDSQYWRTELSTALEAGKSVFVFFTKFEDIFVHTGNTQYSGTGRNARATNIVSIIAITNFFHCNSQ